MEKARALFHEKFYDTNRYRLGRVGRFRINRKLELDVPEDEMTLRPEDLINAIKYMHASCRAAMPTPRSTTSITWAIAACARSTSWRADELRKGFLKLRRTVQERMSLKDVEDMTPRSLINPKSISAAIEYFFGRGELSQVVDQTNPLSMLTHERRLSALGPGGLNRKRAGFEVRDVHISHYGRICPIETPEGTNIGLISSLAIYAGGRRIRLPDHAVSQGRQGQADRTKSSGCGPTRRSKPIVAPADAPIENDKITGETIVARHRADFELVPIDKIQYIDVAPSQMVGVSAGLIPFLEHDDANRALMGSNMQRQAVPLLVTEPPLVGTGHGSATWRCNSGMIVRAGRQGHRHLRRCRPDRNRRRSAIRCASSSASTSGPARTRSRSSSSATRSKRARSSPTAPPRSKGELALGRNVLVAFMSWDGYNFEDAIIISEELVKNDTYTSIHIEEFDIEIRETKLGREEFTRDIPNVSEKMLAQSRRERHRAHRHVRRAGRHPGRQGFAEEPRPS